MTPPRKNASSLEPAAGNKAAVSDFVGVMGKLRAVIEEENDFLSRGMPATLLDTTRSKGALSDELGARGAELVTGAGGEILSDPALHEQLIKASAELRALTAENRQLLDKALAASRRRIDAVMAAVRAAESEDRSDDDRSPRQPERR